MSLPALTVSPLPAPLTQLPNPMAAYTQVLPLLASLPDDQLVAVNVDIPTVVAKIPARVERLQTLIPEVQWGLRREGAKGAPGRESRPACLW